jgi:hypothetical protein
MRIGPAGRYWVILAIAAGLTSAAACGGGSSGPATLPALSSSVATPTPAATAASPVTPPSPATSPTPSTRRSELAAATTVVRRYYALVARVSRHMNAAPIAALMTPTCACQKFPDQISQLRAKQEHFFGSARVLAYRPHAEGRRTVSVLVAYNAGSGGIANRHDRVLATSKPLHDATLNYTLQHVGARWLIAKVTVLAAGRS